MAQKNMTRMDLDQIVRELKTEVKEQVARMQESSGKTFSAMFFDLRETDNKWKLEITGKLSELNQQIVSIHEELKRHNDGFEQVKEGIKCHEEKIDKRDKNNTETYNKKFKNLMQVCVIAFVFLLSLHFPPIARMIEKYIPYVY